MVGTVPFSAYVIFEAVLAPFALFLGWWFGQPPLSEFAWDEDSFYLGLAAALPMLGLLVVLLQWPVGPLASIKQFLYRELAPALEGCHWPDLALVSIAAGVGEEMLFRGVIQGSLTYYLGRVAAIAVTGLLFGLLHPVSIAYVCIAGLLGVYLGVVHVASGNLLTVITAHAAYDFAALLFLLERVRESESGD
jgi:membrane protease YdiL (CAAX protease family)